MEKDMMNMQLSEVQKEYLRNRWRQNETEYLREQRRKVDVSAFVKLKTIGHGNFLHLLCPNCVCEHSCCLLSQVPSEWSLWSGIVPPDNYLQ